jgi:hypothetical protein
MTSPHPAILDKLVASLPAGGVCLTAMLCLYGVYWYVVPPSWRRPLLILAAAVILLRVFGPVYVLLYSAIILATFVVDLSLTFPPRLSTISPAGRYSRDRKCGQRPCTYSVDGRQGKG